MEDNVNHLQWAPGMRPERVSRVENYRRYWDNWDLAFGKTAAAQTTAASDDHEPTDTAH